MWVGGGGIFQPDGLLNLGNLGNLGNSSVLGRCDLGMLENLGMEGVWGEGGRAGGSGWVDGRAAVEGPLRQTCWLKRVGTRAPSASHGGSSLC